MYEVSKTIKGYNNLILNFGFHAWFSLTLAKITKTPLKICPLYYTRKQNRMWWGANSFSTPSMASSEGFLRLYLEPWKLPLLTPFSLLFLKVQIFRVKVKVNILNPIRSGLAVAGCGLVVNLPDSRFIVISLS